MRIATKVRQARGYWIIGLFAVTAALLLASCGGNAPTGSPTRYPSAPGRPALAFTLPPTWTPEPTRTIGPQNTATISPSLTITATVLGINNPYLTGVEGLLPEGSRPLREKAWRISGGEGPFWSYMILPVEQPGGLDVALLGLPRGEGDGGAGGWDRKTIYLLWLWSIEKREPAAWAEIRQLPYAPEQAAAAFLAKDADGNWHAVALNLDKDVTAGPLLPVEDPGDVFLAVVDGADERLYVLRGGERIAVYNAGDLLWEQSPAPEGQVTVVNGAPPSRVDGTGPAELMLYWPGTGGWPAARSDTLQLLQRTESGMKLVAETTGQAQFLETDGDGFREFLLPDDASNPTLWEVQRWDGERYAPGMDLLRPEPPTAQAVTDWENLPALPASLYLRGADGRWAVWPEKGGALAEATGEPPEPQPCTAGASGAPCRSPDGRYEITALTAEPEPTSIGTPVPTIAAELPTATAATVTPTVSQTADPSASPTATQEPTATPLPRLLSAVRDRNSGRVVEIPGTLNYAGTSSFAWGPDGLLMGRAGLTGGLYRVNPATGAATPLLETLLCAPGLGPCPQNATGIGVISPAWLPGGAIGFAAQSTIPGQYPLPGIYRRDADGKLHILAALRQLEAYCVASRAGFDFGQVLWSPDGEAFLYYSPPACLDGIVLLGRTDGSALYDLSNLPGAVTDLRWGE